MDAERIKQFEIILEKEKNLISEISGTQKDLRKAVMSKSWDELSVYVNILNDSSSSFQKLDAEREAVQKELTSEELQPFAKKLTLLRSKLSQSKIENKALCDYISITRGFLDGVIEQASPKTYSRYGQIVQKQPVSVVLNINC